MTNLKHIIRTKRNRYLQNSIADKLGVTSAYVSMLLNGKRKNKEMLKKIEKMINVTN